MRAWGGPQGQALSPAWLPAGAKPTHQAGTHCHCDKDSVTGRVSPVQVGAWWGDSPRGRVPSPG